MRGLVDDDKPLLKRKVIPGVKIALITVLSIALMMLDHANDSLSPIRSTLAVVAQPVQATAELPGDALHYLTRYFSRDQLIERNEALSQKVLLLRSQLEKLAALKSENDRIRALLSSADSLDQKVLITRILAVSSNPYRQYVKLNKGSSDGVFVGQALIDGHGIMGQVTRVTPLNAQAILISDPGQGIPVEINRTGLQTIAQGTGRTSTLKLPFLADNANVKPGDLIVTSGLGGRYPAGYPVATITHVNRQPGKEFLDVDAKPAARLKRGREALLVWNSRKPQTGEKDSGAEQTTVGASNDAKPKNPQPNESEQR